ncbi:hypothetical protein [Diplocloster hominis]
MDSREYIGNTVRRRRVCPCGYQYYTLEKIIVIKDQEDD